MSSLESNFVPTLVSDPFFIQVDNIYFVPTLHHNMEMAAFARKAFLAVQPDCVAVELPESLQEEMISAASRLPQVSVLLAHNPPPNFSSFYYLSQPADALFEALRSGLEIGAALHCIDLAVANYPQFNDLLPDPYAAAKIGLSRYYHLTASSQNFVPTPLDEKRELHLARRLKELSLRHDKVLFIGGLSHIESLRQKVQLSSYPTFLAASQEISSLCTLSEESLREVLPEEGFTIAAYEKWRIKGEGILDRQQLLLSLYKAARGPYEENSGLPFRSYHLKNTMKFARNLAFAKGKLLPSFFQQLTAAKGAVDHNFAYEVWEIATHYPFQKESDPLPALNLTPEEIWGQQQSIRFHLRQKGKKGMSAGFKQKNERRKGREGQEPFPFKSSPYGICSYPPEDVIVEKFSGYLQKRGAQILSDEMASSQPFSTSLEEGIDMRETIRHLSQKQLYVKVQRRPSQGVGSIVVIFDEDPLPSEKYPWRTTWLGEHNQESDMAFYATPMGHHRVGPGICRCEYGGFMMSYPPRRLFDVWSDPDYEGATSKAEVLLLSAIDYALKPGIVYVAAKPPRSQVKSYAARFGKKVIYIPLAQLSPLALNKMRLFHVLDGANRRSIADDYIL